MVCSISRFATYHLSSPLPFISLARQPSRAASTIKKIVAREIIDSRGNPTVEVCLRLHAQARVQTAS